MRKPTWILWITMIFASTKSIGCFSERFDMDYNLMKNDQQLLPSTNELFQSQEKGIKRGEIPDTATLFGQNIGSGKEFSTRTGSVTAREHNKTIIITPKESRNGFTPKFHAVIQRLSMTVKDKIVSLPGSFSQEKQDLKQVAITKLDGGKFKYEMESESSLGIRYFDLKIYKLVIHITAVATSNNVEKITFKIDGQLDIGLAETSISVTGNETHAEYQGTLNNSSPFTFVDRVFGQENTDEVLSFITEDNLREIFQTEIPELKLVAVTEKDESCQYLIYTEHLFTKTDINLKVYAMVSKDKHGNFSVSFFAKVSTKASLKKIVESMTDIKGFPEIKLFEGLEIQVVASVSSREILIISTPVLDGVLKDVFYDDFTSTIPKGIAVHFSSELKDKLLKCSKAPNIPDFPDTSMITVKIDGNGVDVVPQKVVWPAKEIITCISQVADDFFTSDFFSDWSKIQFNKIHYNRTDGSLEVDVIIKKKIEIFSPEFVTINNLIAKVKKENKTEKVNFNIEFNITVDGSVYTGNISREGQDHNVKLTATVLPISKILSKVTFNGYRSLQNSFASVIDFGIKDFLLEAKWKEDSTYRIAGTPYIYGFDKVSFEAVVWTKSGQKNMAFGIKFDQISINDIIQTITGTETTTGAWLSGIDIVVVVASQDDGLSQSVDEVAAKKKEAARPKREIIMGNGNIDEALYNRQFARGIHEQAKVSRRRLKRRIGSLRNKKTTKFSRATRSLSTKTRKRYINGALQKHNRSPQKLRLHSRTRNARNRPQTTTPKPSTAAPQAGTSTTTAKESEITKMEFIHDAMKSIAVAGGVTVKAEFNIPATEEGCKGDEVCTYIRERMGKTKLTLLGAFSKDNGRYKVNITANIDSDTRLIEDGNLYFTNARLEIIIFGLNSSVQIQASLEYRISESDKITFTGLIEANSNQLKLELTMDGMWKKPFDCKWLGFGNLAVSAVFQFKKPSLMLGFGGTLMLGKIDEENVIEISVYFGFDTTLPSNSYIYGNISEITIGKISEVFDLDISSSKPVQNTGFPEGLVFSYNGALTEKKIEKFDITVKKGLFLKGKIEILGYTIAGELEFNDGRLKLAMDLDPISIGDEFIIIQKSKGDDKNGPKIDIEISRNPVFVSFNISGYIYVVGLGAEVIIQVSNDRLYMRIEGKMFDAFTASVEIIANYGNLAEALFTFTGCISSDLTIVREKIAEFLLSIQRKAKELSDKAMKVKEATDAMQKRIARDMEMRKEAANTKKELAKELLDKMKQAAANNQKNCDEECPEGCQSGLTWKEQCFKIFGYWVGCPSISDCAYKGQSALCLAGCHITNAANAVVDWAKEVVFKVKNAFINLQDFIINAVEGIKIAVLELGKQMITVFRFITEAVGNMAAIAAERIKTDNSFLDIKHICVTGGAAAGKSACIELDVDLFLFTTRINFKKPFCIGKNFLDNAAKSSVAGKYPKAEQIEDRSKEFDNEVDHIEEQKDDLVKKEAEVDASAHKEESELEERSNIPERPRRHTNGGIFDINMINSTIISKFDRSLPNNDIMSQTEENLVSFDGDHSLIAAFFKDKNSRSTCSQTRSVVNKYDEITKGAKFLAENTEQQRRRFKKENQLYNLQLEFMKKSVDEAEKTPNITFAERQELKFWYQRAQSKVDYWADSVETQLNGYDKKVMKTYKRQLDTIVGEHTKRDTIAYMGGLLEKGEDLIRRSSIPGDEADKRSGILKLVHEGLEELLRGQSNTLPATKRSLEKISGHINSLKSYHDNCT